MSVSQVSLTTNNTNVWKETVYANAKISSIDKSNFEKNLKVNFLLMKNLDYVKWNIFNNNE